MSSGRQLRLIPSLLLAMTVSTSAAIGVRAATAAEIEVRFVAAEQRARPPVSDLVSFRRSPDGGLIAVQWVSGVVLNGEPLFPVENTDPATKSEPNLAKLAGKPKVDGVDELLDDIRKDDRRKPEVRAVDVVDEQYQGRTLSDGRRIGPVRRRRSVAMVNLLKQAELAPGGWSVETGKSRREIDCLPLTITATRDGESATFTPRLTLGGQDLLVDCLFEHSPDLPQGDESPLARGTADGQLGWMNATRGGQRLFRKLTIYLPLSADPQSEPYRLNGQAFRMMPRGVVLAAGASGLRQSSPFEVEISLPPEPASPVVMPAVVELGGDWQVVQNTFAVDSQGAPQGDIRLRSARHGDRVLQPRLPAAPARAGTTPRAQWHRHLQLVCSDADASRPLAQVIELPEALATQSGRLTVRLAQVDERGAVSVPETFAAVLHLSPPMRGAPGLTEAKAMGNSAAPLGLQFKRTSPEVWEAALGHVPAGLHGLRLELTPAPGRLLPVVVATPQTKAAVSLFTYHNRADYLRGETVHVCLQTRAIADVRNRKVRAVLTGATTGRPVSHLVLNCAAGETQTLFLPIDTSRLALGTCRVTLKEQNSDATPEGLIVYATEFTLHPDAPRTTFALHAWMTGSFSGPLKTGDKPLVNLVLGQKPSAFLTPAELERLTSQPAYPQTWHASLVQDLLYPAPHTSSTYDAETEREAAIAMRLGMRYCPDYGWGMNSQEAAWNPKHTLADELDRIGRLCTQVTQRHRDFGNFGGLHLNWYPRLGGNWENHPPTDGNAEPRSAQLAAEAAEVFAETAEDKRQPDGGLQRAVRAHKYRVAALSRAYERWTARARELSPGLGDGRSADPVLSRFPPDQQQPGLTGSSTYTSFVPVGWFQQRNYYPTAYHAGLPVAGVHAYTDYGFSPFQPLWAVDHWAAGLGDRPRWVTTMSNGRDIMLGHALLLAGRGADGIDINGQDPQAASAISDFLSAYGPLFRTMQPHSDVAIITSLRQQFSNDKLIGQWMGYTGGEYFNLYTRLWYARHPPAMLPEEDITPERLRQFKAVFLVGQEVPLPGQATSALQEYLDNGGHIFKDAATAEGFPGKRFDLKPAATAGKDRPAWDPEQYNATRDRFFVGTQAGYEEVADSLRQLLEQLSPPLVNAPDHSVLLTTLRPPALATSVKQTDSTASRPPPRIAAAVFAVNDRHAPPGITHPWNFWSATILAQRTSLDFDQPYVLYDLLDGGQEHALKPRADGRFVLPVEFDRCSARGYLATTAPVRQIEVRIPTETAPGPVPVAADILDDRDRAFTTPFPCEVTVVSPTGEDVQTIYRALGGDRQAWVTLPAEQEPARWQIRVRELVSGRVATTDVQVAAETDRLVTASPVLIPRPAEIIDFLAASDSPAAETREPVLIVLDSRQVARDPDLSSLARRLQQAVGERGRPAEVLTSDAQDIVELPLRWRPTARDRHYLAEAQAGSRIVMAASLRSLHERNRDGTTGALDVLHPDCGWLEPGAAHRIYRDVILLGTPAHNRFLADLHDHVGMSGDRRFLAGGATVVQVIHEAFTPGHACLTIQGESTSSLQAGVDALLALAGPGSREKRDMRRSPTRLQAIRSDASLPLPNPIRNLFGAAVHPKEFRKDGSLLVWADTQAQSYYVLNAQGELQRKWLGKYAVELDQQTRPGNTDTGMWIYNWWGVPGYVDAVVRADADAHPQWLMPLPRYSRSFQGWQHPGRRVLVDPAGNDVFVSGNGGISRIRPDGELAWHYDDVETSQDVESFRFVRDLMLHGASLDGRFLLVAAYGIEPYANFVSRFVRPAVLLFDARSGKILWEKSDLLIDHSACGFVAPDKLVLADATPGSKRLILCDAAGEELWSLPRPDGTSEARLSPDGHWLVVRPEAVRDANHQLLGSPVGLAAVPVRPADGTVTRAFPLSDAVHTWLMRESDGRVLVSTVDGWLRCFEPDTTLVWEQHFNGACNLLDAPAGNRIAVGTQNGMLLMLDGNGQVLQRTDLMLHNVVLDEKQYVRDYTASPAEAPIRDARPELPPRIDVRSGKSVQFSSNLLEALPSVRKLAEPLKKTVVFKLPSTPAGTAVLSLTQRNQGGRAAAETDRLHVEVRRGDSPEAFYAAAVSLSPGWEERTFSWKLAAEDDLSVTLRYAGSGEGVEIRDPGLWTVKYPSRNVLAQKLPDAPDVNFDEPAGDVESLLGDAVPLTPPSVRMLLPNDVDLTARARGAAPFRPVVPFTALFDGKAGSPNSSWLGRPLSGSTHAQVQLTFKTPVTLTVFALHDDPGAPCTTLFAVFGRNAKTRQWKMIGYSRRNGSPFNLFTCEPITVDAVTYYWGASDDGHARLTEFEAYQPPGLLVP